MSQGAVQERSASGERRLVTVVFADLVGSTVLSQRLDPEDYAEVVLTYQETARSVIEKNGGVVANFSGDGVVGQFGFPDSHENDAERAVVSGLEICEAVVELQHTLGEELDVEIECRVGLHSSVSVVGMLGAYRQDMSIFGDTANIASRVEGVAGPLEVAATRAVIDLLRGEFETTDHQVVELKGIDQPIEVARIVGRADMAAPIESSVHVGRAGSLRELHDHWTCARAGQGAFVAVSAEAGVGKSAVVRRFLSQVEGVVVTARGRALAAAQPFSVLAELADTAASVPQAGVITELLGAGTAAGSGAASAEERWQQIFEAGIALLDALSTQPVVVVVEDLHWVDASTDELLRRFAKSIADRPCLLLITTRPGPALDDAVVVDLEPLDDAEIRELVVTHATAELAEEITEDIVRRSQGVPLYAVELARAATADSLAPLPDSLQSSLLARLAQRPELTHVAQVASVLGDDVDPELLAGLLESDVASVSADLASLDGSHVLEIVDGNLQFAHSLLREAIYGSLLRRDRRALHRKAADALRSAGAFEDHRVSVVGHHLALAGRRVESGECYAVAARRAASLGAFQDAVELTDTGLDALGAEPEPSSALLALLITRGNALFATVGYAAPGLFELWCRAESVAADIGDRLEQSSGMNGQSVAALFDAEYDLAVERADRLVALGAAHDDRPARVRGYCSRALPQLYSGQIAAALENAERAIELYRDGDYELLTYGFGTDQLAIAHTTAAMSAFFAGDDRADDFLDLSIDHARRIGSPITQAMVHNSAAMYSLFAERPEEVLHHVAETWAVCDRFGLAFFRTTSTLTKAAALALQGERTAPQLAYSALGDAGGSGSKLALTVGIYAVARCEEAAGNLDGAFDLAEMGLGMVEQQQERMLEVELRLLQWRCRGGEATLERLVGVLDRARARGAWGSVERAEAAVGLT